RAPAEERGLEPPARQEVRHVNDHGTRNDEYKNDRADRWPHHRRFVFRRIRHLLLPSNDTPPSVLAGAVPGVRLRTHDSQLSTALLRPLTRDALNQLEPNVRRVALKDCLCIRCRYVPVAPSDFPFELPGAPTGVPHVSPQAVGPCWLAEGVPQRLQT